MQRLIKQGQDKFFTMEMKYRKNTLKENTTFNSYLVKCHLHVNNPHLAGNTTV